MPTKVCASLRGVSRLDGTLRHADGVLPMVSIAKRHGIETVYVPYEDAPEAGLVEGATVIPIRRSHRHHQLNAKHHHCG